MLSFGIVKKWNGRGLARMTYIPIMVFGFWPKIVLQKELHGKEHYHNSKSNCSAKDALPYKLIN